MVNLALLRKGRKPRRNRLKRARVRGSVKKAKPPIFGMIQCSGDVVIRMLKNVKQATIKPLIEQFIKPAGTLSVY